MGARYEARRFRVPLAQQILALVAGLAFVVLAALVALADRGALPPELARLLRGNPDALGPEAFAALVGLAGVGTLLRAWLSGVTIEEDRIVTRTSPVLGFPRVRSAYWAELRGASLERGAFVLVQFDGSSFTLPEVGDPEALEEALRERLGRFAIPMGASDAQGAP